MKTAVLEDDIVRDIGKDRGGDLGITGSQYYKSTGEIISMVGDPKLDERTIKARIRRSPRYQT